MPREIITLQVGQCGNQIGRRFWDMALAEHAQQLGVQPQAQQGPWWADPLPYDDSMSSFFHQCPSASSSSSSWCAGLKARAVLVDMEEGPVSETVRGPLGDLFDSTQLITDVSGAGNNFAHGHYVYGPQYGDTVLEAVRVAAELCDSLQSFFLMHSLGGGTGSGLGTYLLGLLEDAFPGVHRFVTAVFPSQDDDVVTSPYNSILALQQLTEHADCVLPVENQSLMALLDRPPPTAAGAAAAGAQAMPAAGRRRRTKPLREEMAAAIAAVKPGGGAFDDMNAVMARVLIDLTASMRFAGHLNVDLNEITTNLVPYPRLHYLMSSLSHPGAAGSVPGHYESLAGPGHYQSQQLKLACQGAFARRNQLMLADPRTGTVLACALLFRGQDLSLSDVTANVHGLRSALRMVPWNPEGFKIGLCSAPAAAAAAGPSLLSLSNNSCMATTFRRVGQRFQRLYARRAMVHHYAQYMDAAAGFEAARDDLLAVIDDYQALDAGRIPGGAAPLAFPVSALF